MKIAYVIPSNNDSEDGVLKKIAGQMRIWLQEGHEAKLFVLSRRQKVWDGIVELTEAIIFSPRQRYDVFRFGKLVQCVKQWQPDIVYIRSMIYLPFVHNLLLSLPVVVEVNTKEVSEMKLRSKFWALYWNMTRGLILRRARGIVTVTNEIAQELEIFKRPTVVIANGIDIQACPELPPANNLNPRLIFIGSPNQSWHGIDKFVWLARHFTKWHFDIVGGHKLDVTLPNLTIHPMLKKNEYMKIMESADIALGTMALHRNEMEEASTLKVREYLACGIPTIIGYRDTDFPQPVPFILQLPNTADNLQAHLNLIEKFVLQWKGRRCSRQQILHLDNSLKEKQRLHFFEKVMGR